MLNSKSHHKDKNTKDCYTGFIQKKTLTFSVLLMLIIAKIWAGTEYCVKLVASLFIDLLCTLRKSPSFSVDWGLLVDKYLLIPKLS